MAFTLRVHETAISPETKTTIVNKSHAYIRIVTSVGYPVFLQDGSVWTEAGDLVDLEELPIEFWNEIEKCSNRALASVKFEHESLYLDEKGRVRVDWKKCPFKTSKGLISLDTKVEEVLPQQEKVEAKVEEKVEVELKPKPPEVKEEVKPMDFIPGGLTWKGKK